MAQLEQTLKKKKQQNRRHIWFLLVLLAVAVLLLVGALVMFGVVISDGFLTTDDEYVTGDDAIRIIEQTLGATLPDSATNFHFSYTAWQDYFMRIRVDVSSADTLDYINQMTVDCLLYIDA